MSSAPRYNPHYTIDDYRLWDGDWELWDGVAVAMTPSPFGKHGHLLARMATALNIAIDAVDCDASVLLEIDWIVSNDTVVRPDLSVVCGDPPAGHIESPPALVAEILSAGTREKDLTHKRRLFEQQRVGWYLIIDPDDDSLQALRLDEEGVYQQVQFGDQLEVELCESCLLNVQTDRMFR